MAAPAPTEAAPDVVAAPAATEAAPAAPDVVAEPAAPSQVAAAPAAPPPAATEAAPAAPDVVAEPAPPAAPTGPVEAAPAGYGVQLAAYLSEQRARQAWAEWRDRLGSLLTPWAPTITAGEYHGRVLYHLRIEGLADADAAGNFCAALVAHGWPECWAVTGHPHHSGSTKSHRVAASH